MFLFLLFLSFFYSFPHSSTVNDVRRKLYMVGIYSTVGKRAKRMPDNTVETTLGWQPAANPTAEPI